MINIQEFFSVLFYIMLIVLVIALIILVINSIKTINKIDKLIDDITEKSYKLNGVFTLIDTATDTVVGFSDNIVSFFTNSLTKIFKRKRDKNE